MRVFAGSSTSWLWMNRTIGPSPVALSRKRARERKSLLILLSNLAYRTGVLCGRTAISTGQQVADELRM